MSDESDEPLNTNPYKSPLAPNTNICSLRSPISAVPKAFLTIAAIALASGGVIAFFISDVLSSIMRETNPYFIVFWPIAMIAFVGCCILCYQGGAIRVIAVIGIVVNLMTMLIGMLIGFVLSRAGPFG